MTRTSRLLLNILLNSGALVFTGELMAQTSVPEIAFDSTPNLLKLPEHTYLGEVPGVATDSKGNLYTGETQAGRRLQRFLYKGVRPISQSK